MGCGWLGLPLAQLLVEKGYFVRGTTTSKAKLSLLKEGGIEPFLILLGENSVEGELLPFLEGLEVLVVNVPPSLRGANTSNYFLKMKSLHEQITSAGVSRVIFVSSTSIYGKVNGRITEITPPNPDSESGKQLLQAEDLFRGDRKLKTAIVRFGGLIGPGRHPVRYLSGRKDLKNGQHPVNLIHLDDCLALLTAILEQGWWDSVINGVHPEHPLKEDYYRTEAEKMGLELPEYSQDSESSEGKSVDSAVLTNKGFEFTHSIYL